MRENFKKKWKQVYGFKKNNKNRDDKKVKGPDIAAGPLYLLTH
jgi:hypothetical protein